MGEYVQPGNKVGNNTPISFEKEIIGSSLRTSENSKPVYVSIGNYITLNDVLAITKHFLISNQRIPLLTFLLDKLTKKLKGLLS